MDTLVELREGWHWPKNDKRCWRATSRHWKLPQEVIKEIANKRVAVQAGGNCGEYAEQYAKAFETVYTFEPENLNFYCLCRNLINCKNIYKFQSFLGTGQETTTSITNPADLQSEANSGMFHKTNTQGSIPVLSIDQLGLTACDLIHLDIEGGEHDALIGATQTINNFKPVVCLEWFQNTEILQKTMSDFGYQDIGFASKSDKMFRYVR